MLAEVRVKVGFESCGDLAVADEEGLLVRHSRKAEAQRFAHLRVGAVAAAEILGRDFFLAVWARYRRADTGFTLRQPGQRGIAFYSRTLVSETLLEKTLVIVLRIGQRKRIRTDPRAEIAKAQLQHFVRAASAAALAQVQPLHDDAFVDHCVREAELAVKLERASLNHHRSGMFAGSVRGVDQSKWCALSRQAQREHEARRPGSGNHDSRSGRHLKDFDTAWSKSLLMGRVTGIGGVFIRARDSAALARWYAEHLGIVEKPGVGIMFSRSDDPDPNAVTLFSIFDADDDYWDRAQPVMINFRVDGLDELIAKLKAEGVTVLEKADDHEYGRFRWIVDPEGNRIELWEPPAT